MGRRPLTGQGLDRILYLLDLTRTSLSKHLEIDHSTVIYWINHPKKRINGKYILLIRTYLLKKIDEKRANLNEAERLVRLIADPPHPDILEDE